MCIRYLRWSLVFLILRCNIPLFSQCEWNNWYFGSKAGVTFQNVSLPTVLLNSNMIAYHVSNVISDSSG
jgi:hypothetical protein